MIPLFRNLDYLYAHLPARYRGTDVDLFLKRMLTWSGEQLDGWDADLDTFYQKIAPSTAPAEFVEFWLWALFGWSWYPAWFSLERKRRLYASFATHLGRRGTATGIEEFLRDFSVHARVFNRPLTWEEIPLDEAAWSIDDALGICVQVSHLTDEVNFDLPGQGLEEMALDEGLVLETQETLTKAEIEDLLRFQWPNANLLMIHYLSRLNLAGPEAFDSSRVVINENILPDENSGPITGAH